MFVQVEVKELKMIWETEEKINKFFAGLGFIRIVKTCDFRCLRQHFQDQSHSSFTINYGPKARFLSSKQWLYGLTLSQQITYMYSIASSGNKL